MNDMLKKLLSLLLSTVLVLSLLPLTAFGADGDDGEGTDETEWQFVSGEVPEEHEYGYPEETRSDYDLASTLPAKYDSRTYGYITKVENQNPYGLCWTFASLGALEANLKKNGVGTFDFSQAHMAYATATYTYGGQTVNADQGFRTDPLGGGNRSVAAAYLMRGTTMSGTVNETDDKYSSINGNSPYRDPAITRGKTKTYSVKDILFLTGGRQLSSPTISSTDAARLKQAVMDYGAVHVSMYWDDSAYNSSKGSFYYNGKAASDGYLTTNHAVLLVGWDDNYSKSNFKSGRQPSKNGAWLIKNSWGTSWGNSGYFWLSYEDTNAPVRGAVYVGADKWNKSTDYIYESDYKSDGAARAYTNGTTYAKVYSVTKAGQSVTSVRVFVPSVKNGNTTVSVDVVPSFSDFSSYKFSARGSRTIDYPGWYTIDLNAPVKLGAKGSKFAAVVQVGAGSYLGYDDYNTTLPSGVSAYWGTLSGSLSTSDALNWSIKAITTTASVTSWLAVKFDTSNVFTVTVTAPKDSVLIAASYDSTGHQDEVRTYTYKSAVTSKTVSTGIKKTSGYTYKAILVDLSSFVPRCAAKTLQG